MLLLGKPGSGVDLIRFQPPERANLKKNEGVSFLFAARLLKEKGVYTYIDAARIVKNLFPETKFYIMGKVLPKDDRSSILKSELDTWAIEGVINYLGEKKDGRSHIAMCDCVVLPTYYPEGTPRIILESMALSVPVICTDVPGCRDVVKNGQNGFLCKPLDIEGLARQMLNFIDLSLDERFAMGSNARTSIENFYDENIVINKYINLINRTI